MMLYPVHSLLMRAKNYGFVSLACSYSLELMDSGVVAASPFL